MTAAKPFSIASLELDPQGRAIIAASDVTDGVTAPRIYSKTLAPPAAKRAGVLPPAAPVVTPQLNYTGGVPTVFIGGSGASRTVVVTAPAGAHGSAIVTITVQDADGLQTAMNFTVNVDQAPALPAIGDVTLNHGSPATTINLGATDPDLDPLTFAVSFTDPLFTLKTQYAITTGPYPTNSHGYGEIYLNSNVGLLVLLPNGQLRKYDNSIIGGTLLASVATTVYQNPDLLLTTTGTPLVSLPNRM